MTPNKKRGKFARMEKQIIGFKDYTVNDLGVVYSVKSGKKRRRAMNADRKGYCRILLIADDGKHVTKYLHRVVLEAFSPPPDASLEVDHIDGNPRNNALSNLRWVTHRENIVNAVARRGCWLDHSKSRKPVLATPVGGGEPVRWESARAWAIASGNGNRAANVCRAIRGGMPAYGYLWSFA